MRATLLRTVLAVSVSAGLVHAHGPNEHRDAITAAPPAARLAQFGRSVAQMHKRAADGSSGSSENDASFSHNDNATFECNYWDYAPELRFQDEFPEGWKIASIMSNDSDAQGLWNSIKGSIPNIPPKGTAQNSLQGSTYDEDADPDCWWTATGCITPKLKGLPNDLAACNEPGTWGLTYDDGPECSHNKFYDFLQDQNQTATLFYIGSNVIGYPLQAQRGLTDGHIISVHTWSHNYMTALSSEQVFAELYYTTKIIKYTIGVTPTSWRPPYGDVDDRVRAIAHALGLETIIWGHGEDTNDWNITPDGQKPTASIEANYESLISQASSPALETGGIIVLSHELSPNTEAMAMQFLPKMKQAFKHVVPPQICQNNTMPYHEQTITYPDFAQYITGDIKPKGVPAANVIQASPAPLTAAPVTTTTVAPPSSSTFVTSPLAAVSSTPSAAASAAATSAPVPGKSSGGNAVHDQKGSAQSLAQAGLPALAAAAAVGALFV